MLCEPVWIHDGVDKREWFEKGLEPDILADDLQRYKMLCSKDFNMSDLLKLKEIQALALLAEAIIDLPEYLTDKIGKMRLDIPVSTDYTSSRMTITETRLIIFLKVTNLRKEKLRGLLR